MLRDAFAPRGPVQLHPREFDFLWRLMDTPGEPVSRTQLIRDVWRLAHVPETNSVAVHASRVRKKLADAGVSDVVRSSPCGGYFVAGSTPRALPLVNPESPLDGHVWAADDG
jgi:DNA-binding response OmpR family regulator